MNSAVAATTIWNLISALLLFSSDPNHKDITFLFDEQFNSNASEAETSYQGRED
jgi:hypothetical protein